MCDGNCGKGAVTGGGYADRTSVELDKILASIMADREK